MHANINTTWSADEQVEQKDAKHQKEIKGA